MKLTDRLLKIADLVSKDIKKGTIIYTVNEKINAIAPKITR